MKNDLLIHVPHSSLYIPKERRNEILLTNEELEAENLLLCDLRVDELVPDDANVLIFPYSRLYCDVERFPDEREDMNSLGMGYIYTRTTDGKVIAEVSEKQRKIIRTVYDEHHEKLNKVASDILAGSGRCIILDLHSFCEKAVRRMFGYDVFPDICIGYDAHRDHENLHAKIAGFFLDAGYSVQYNFPYSGSIIPNKYYDKPDSGITSVMLEINRRTYLEDFDDFKRKFETMIEIIVDM